MKSQYRNDHKVCSLNTRSVFQ